MNIIPNNNNIEMLTPTGFQPFSALYVSDPEERIVVSFDDGTVKHVSSTHLFISNDKSVIASSLKKGDLIDSSNKQLKVLNLKTITNMVHMGPLNVYEHVYQTTDGIKHHNCQFIGSSTTLINADALTKLKFKEPIAHKYGFTFNIFEYPIKDAFYIMGVDSATGSGKDYSVIQILRLHRRGKYEQVAVYRDNNISVGRFSVIIKDIAEYYNNALSIVENNESGALVANEAFYTLGYDGILNTDKHGIGTRATKTSKLLACNTLKQMIEDGELIINDMETIHELSIFEEVSPNVFKAPRNKHDDLVSGLYWACFGIIRPEIDLDDLSIVDLPVDDVPQTFFGDSTDMDDFDTSWAF